MTGHLPDCDDYAFSGAGFHPNCGRICICRQVLRIERRALDAAREAVAALPEVAGWTGELAIIRKSIALAAIDALREQS